MTLGSQGSVLRRPAVAVLICLALGVTLAPLLATFAPRLVDLRPPLRSPAAAAEALDVQGLLQERAIAVARLPLPSDRGDGGPANWEQHNSPPDVGQASAPSASPSERLDASIALPAAAHVSPPGKPMAVDVVVARYDEDISWLPGVVDALRHHGVRATAFLYEKGPPSALAARPDIVAARLPNVGREAHTYLHHMAAARARPSGANVTLYLQAALRQHSMGLTELQMTQALVFQAMRHGLSSNVRNAYGTKRIGRDQRGVRSHAYNTVNDAHAAFRVDTLKNVDDARGGTLGEWFNTTFAAHVGCVFPPRATVSFYPGACFAVHAALRLPPAVVDAGLAELAASNAPGLAHFFERAWFLAFHAVRAAAVAAADAPPTAAGWGADGLDPRTLDQRWRVVRGRRFKQLNRFAGWLLWEWEGCECRWEGAKRLGEVTYSCPGLRAESDPALWRWELPETAARDGARRRA